MLFWIGIAVAMGFDSGFNNFAFGIALLYLTLVITFLIPAFIPFKLLIKPPPILKIYYLWCGFILAIYALIKTYHFLDFLTADNKFDASKTGKICIKRVDKFGSEIHEYVNVFSKNQMGERLFSRKKMVRQFSYK